MKPQQLFTTHLAVGEAFKAHARCARASLPIVTTVALAIASSIVLTLAGCASSAGIAPVAQVITPASIGLSANPAAAVVPAVEADWWRSFGDSTLNDLVERSLAANPSLKVAQLRLARAQAAVSGAQAAEGPQVNGSLDLSRQRFSATSIYPPPLGGSIRTLGTAQAQRIVGVRLLRPQPRRDRCGRRHAARRAGRRCRPRASCWPATWRAPTSSSARLFEQREVAMRSLKQREEILALIHQRVRGGLDTAVELRQGEGALPETRQQIEQLDEQIALTRHALAALTAQAPNALDGLTAPLRTRASRAAAGRGAGRPARPPRRHRRRALARRGRHQRRDEREGAVLSEHQPDGLRRPVEHRPGPARRRRQRAVRRRPGDPPADLRRGPAARQPARPGPPISTPRSRATTAPCSTPCTTWPTRSARCARSSASRREQASAQAAAEAAYDLATQRYQAGLGTYLTVLNAEATVLTQRRLGGRPEGARARHADRADPRARRRLRRRRRTAQPTASRMTAHAEPPARTPNRTPEQRHEHHRPPRRAAKATRRARRR